MEILRRLCLSICLFFVFFSIIAQNDSITLAQKEKYVTKKKWHQFNYNSPEWQMYLDSAILIEPRNADLWQQKSMPYMKNGEYYNGMRFLNKAVEYDTLDYLGYRGFMKCIFMKDYAPAIVDLKAIYKKHPLEQIMDHSYPFWIGISFLKLNQLDSANHYLELSIQQNSKKGKEWVHYVDWFYAGLTKYKMKDYPNALAYFENAIGQNSHFPDAEYYKAELLIKRNKKNEEAKKILLQAKNDLENGYRMNEDNEIYVNYPFQITIFEINQLLNKLQ